MLTLNKMFLILIMLLSKLHRLKVNVIISVFLFANKVPDISSVFYFIRLLNFHFFSVRLYNIVCHWDITLFGLTHNKRYFSLDNVRKIIKEVPVK